MSNKTIMTGFSGLDKVLGGLRPGTLNVISGRPGMGKTSLALNIAMNAAKTSGKAVVYFSVETERTQVVKRLFLPELLETREANMAESIKTILNGFEDLPIYIDDRSHLTPELLIERFDALLTEKTDIGLVIVDCLNLISFSKDTSAYLPASFLTGGVTIRDIAMAAGTHALKNLALKYKVPVVALAQCGRYYRKDHIPALKDIYSEPLRQEADSVIFIVRPVYYIDDPISNANVIGHDRDAQLIVAKNNYGESDVSITVRWHVRVASFTDTDSDIRSLKQE